jgi:flagellar biosynthesis regulator FlaF
MSYAANQYRRAAASALSPREAEAAAFIFVNRLLEAVSSEPQGRVRALGKNHDLWSMLLKDVGLDSNRLPPILKGDLVSVGMWSMRYSVMAMGDERGLDPLIRINEDMIEALRGGAPFVAAGPDGAPFALAG